MKRRSGIFYTNRYKHIEKKIKSFLNTQKDFLSTRTVNSPRAVGDAIENVLADNFQEIVGDAAKEYSSSFARRPLFENARTFFERKTNGTF